MTFGISDDENQIIFDPKTKVVSSPNFDERKCRGLGYEFHCSMKKFNNTVAQYNADINTSDTYAEILKKAIRVALNLKARNIRKDDTVCFCSYNHCYTDLPVLASLFLNVEFTSIDQMSQTEVATLMLKEIKPKICFVAPESVDLFKQSLKSAELESEIVFYDNLDTNIRDLAGCTRFSDFLKPHEEENNFVPAQTDPSDTFSIYFSSGSTGMPKGVRLNHKQLFHDGLVLKARGFVQDHPPVILSYSTYIWYTSILHLTLAIFTGGARVVSKACEPISFWKILDKYKVTYTFVTPFQISNIISVKRPDNIDTTKLKLVTTGGCRFPSEMNLRFRVMLQGTLLSQFYGMTETGVLLLFDMRDNKDRSCVISKPDSVGKPIPAFNYKIVDPETERPCGINEKGELRVKSEFLSNGYLASDFLLALDEDGYFKTGDIAYFDEDFCFTIVDRIKDLIKYRNRHVSPTYLEQVLNTHPAVKQSVIIGLPHKADGDHPMAIVIRRENHEISEKSLEDYVNERVDDAHKLRGGVKFLKSIPLTPSSGKVKKMDLKRMVLEGEI